jgi:hypothetical protein
MATENSVVPTGPQALQSSAASPSSDASSSLSSIPFTKETQQHNPPYQNGTNNGIEADALDEINIPYRSLTSEANMRAYTTKTPPGNIPREVQSNNTGRTERYELVTFTVGDPENPKNWSKLFKWWCTMVVSFTCFKVAFNSAVVTADIRGPAEEFGVSEEVSLLAITMFVIGIGIGPMAFAPMSEILGRRIIYGTTLFVAVMFIIPCAVSKNAATLVICRLIDGIAFSAPMTLGELFPKEPPTLNLDTSVSLTSTHSGRNIGRSLEARGKGCPHGCILCSSFHWSRFRTTE